jgi:perosamine synthetase
MTPETLRVAVPDIGEAEIEAVIGVLRTGMLVQGPRVLAFEAQLAREVGVRHAIAVSSGTAALHLALLGLDVGPGHEVVLPDFTHPATANVVELCGATPVFVDVDLATLNVDPAEMARAITPRTRALMPVHLFGQPADMAPLLELARERELPLVEDAACALGALYRGTPCGALGRVGCFSFHPRKIITTGEGGLLTTDDDALAERLRLLRNHGLVAGSPRFRFEAAGFNYRLTDFQAALGSVQLSRLPDLIEKRAALAASYHSALAGLAGVTTPATLADVRHVWQSYVVLLADGLDRDGVQARLRERGVETTLGTYAVSAQAHHGRGRRPLPRSFQAQERSLSLPLHTRMAEQDVQRVARTLAECLT